MKKRNPSSGQNGQLVHWWLLIKRGWPTFSSLQPHNCSAIGNRACHINQAGSGQCSLRIFCSQKKVAIIPRSFSQIWLEKYDV
jgi:hypothetical protein